jgi:pimeloyl-ACP methyl ester carboxylesterase
MGFSSGGPYAVACATLLPGRVTAAGIVAGVTDMGWSDAWDGFEEAEATLMRLGDEAKVAAWCEQHYGPDGARFFDSTGDLAPADVEVLQDETVTAGLFATITEAFRQGVAGYAQDVTIQSTPWFFDPRTITAPTRLYHGEADTIIPISHGRHTAELISESALTTFPGRGHISMITEVPHVASDLVAQRT